MFAYEAASATQFKHDFGNGEITDGDPDRACALFDSYIEEFQRVCSSTNVVVTFSCPTRTYWRHKIWPTYKAQRHGGTRPVALGAVREYASKKYDTVVVTNLEADDVMGILATSDKTIKGIKTIVSVDKDMKQIPGLLYNPKGGNGIVHIDSDQADRWHLYQTLVGDATDNYPGCPRIGPIKAERILEKGKWPDVLAAFIKAGKDEEYALTQARTARILRAGEWNKTTKEATLWTP